MNPRVPRHVAIIMDGNGRWATERGLPRFMGHRAGMEAVREVITAASELGVEVLTLFAFSTENWKRPRSETSALMNLLLEYLEREIPDLISKRVRLCFMGDLGMLPPGVAKAVRQAEEETRHNKGLKVVIALSYGGRWDIMQAAREIARKARDRTLRPEEVTEQVFASHLASAGIGDPDLIIRASGELRLSNFYLWQAAYSEIWCTSVYWPEFRRKHLEEALNEYGLRERRYGELGGGGMECSDSECSQPSPEGPCS